MPFDSLASWLQWLEQCHPKEIDLGLERIRRVAAQLDLLNPSARVITVAGTNGKGSCVAASAALLQAAGHSVGVYTSPHLLRYNERIAVNGEFASDEEICSAFAAIHAACQDISLTYFEYGTLAALEIFRRRNVDVMVLEVGLGGRLDAVNILAPDVAVITSIDLDHQDWLGTDREAIGAEKAGIMRSGRPAVCADPVPPASLAATAANIGARWCGIGEFFGFDTNGHSWHWWGTDADAAKVEVASMPLPSLPLPSMAAALQAVVLIGVDLTAIPVAQILSNLRLPGRFQTLDWAGVEVILDVAHNPAASTYLARRLHARPVAGRTFAIVGMMADKDRLESLRNLSGEIDSWFLAELADVGRAASVAQLAEDLAQLQQAAQASGSVSECLSKARAAAQAGDRIVVWGSFYTVAAALAVLLPSLPGGER